jgi:electron transfer flavoprotein alpha/beta subunit
VNVLVFLKEFQDSTIRLEFDAQTKRLRDDWNVHRLNPADASALRLALGLKERYPETRITLIHMGPPLGERRLREGLALGCDEALRIWDEGLDTLRSPGKALIFARVAVMLGFDLLLAGARSQDGMNGQVGPLVASHLNLPCVTAVLSLERGAGNDRITAVTRLARGFQERVESSLPLVATVEAHGAVVSFAPIPDLLAAAERPLPCFDLARLGIPWALLQQIDNRLRFGPLQQVRPRLKPIPAPDSALPAFERIRKLVEGVLKPREGRVIQKDEAALAEAIFQTLLSEGWLDHLRKVQQ